MAILARLTALAKAEGPFWQPTKYCLLPPLRLATLATYLVYITNAYRAYWMLTPYPGTKLYADMDAAGRILTHDRQMLPLSEAVLSKVKPTPQMEQEGTGPKVTEAWGGGPTTKYRVKEASAKQP